MPWCATCDHLIEEEEIVEAETCPTCGTVLLDTPRKIPRNFKIMIALSVVYLGYRSYQGITWLVHHS